MCEGGEFSTKRSLARVRTHLRTICAALSRTKEPLTRVNDFSRVSRHRHEELGRVIVTSPSLNVRILNVLRFVSSRDIAWLRSKLKTSSKGTVP